MSGWLSFDPVFPLFISVLLTAGLLAVLVWKELQGRRNGVLKGFGIAFTIVGFAGLILRPSVVSTGTALKILLTDGYADRVADSLLNHYPNAEAYLAPASPKSNKQNHNQLISWHELSHIQPVDIIAGEGLPRHALELLDDQKFVFLPSKTRTGFVRVDLPKNIKANRVHEISGEYIATEPSTLVLKGPQGVEDSVTVDKGTSRFALKFVPKTYGPVTLSLGEKTKQSETVHRIGLYVEEPVALTVLFLQDYPTFESGYLKNFLARNQRVTVRYRLSRNIFRYENLNMSPGGPQALSRDYLKVFDLVVLTPSTYQSLSRIERTQIDSAVHRGAGLLFIQTEAGIPAVDNMPVLKGVKSVKDTVNLQLSGRSRTTIHTGQYEIPEQPRLNSILMHNGKSLTGYVNQGFGRIGYSVFEETYPLLLRGDSIDYAKLWTPVLEATARKKAASGNVRIASQWPHQADVPVHLDIFTASSAPELFYDGSRIPVKEDVLLSNVWSATIWPNKEGWNKITSESDSVVLSFFVNGTQEFQSLQSWENYRITKAHATSALPDRKTREAEPVDPVVFYLLFLTGISLLWLLPKIA